MRKMVTQNRHRDDWTPADGPDLDNQIDDFVRYAHPYLEMDRWNYTYNIT